jgi:DNA primase
MSVTEEIKSRLDIVDVIGEQVQLRKSGRNYAGFCPFHANTRTPAFYVFPETQTWRCFGACAEGGDLFSFVMKKEGWDFKEALEYLARRAGVMLEQTTPAARARKQADDALAQLLTAAAEYFHQLLLHAPQAEHARRYVAERQLNAETVDAFRLGFALESWDACRTHFNGQGYSDDDLLKAGLLTENPERGTRYDRFRNRLMIPIRDVNGRVVGFGARTLDPDGIPKYLNSPQTALFDKSHILFGLDMAKRHIREARQAVIVEGYMDVMQGWQLGFRNIIAQMGTALTEQQLQLLKRYTKRFVLALDADAAGAKATLRSLRVARETLDREYEVRFDARGLVQYEGRLKADIHVVTLPAGHDPDKIMRTDPTAWPKLLEKAKPVVAYVIGVATQDLDLRDAKAKSAVAQQVLPLISDVGDPIERAHYLQQLARALRVDERTLRLVPVSDRATQRRMPPPPPPDAAPLPNGPAGVRKQARPLAPYLREANFLRQCLTYPQLILQVNQTLHAQTQTAVTPDDFGVIEDRLLLELIQQRATAVMAVTAVVGIEELCDSLDDVLQARAKTLLTLPPTPESELSRLPDRLVMSVLDWRLARAKVQLTQVQQLFTTAQGEGAPDAELAGMYAQKIHDLRLTMHQLNRAKEGMSAVGKRRAEYGW